MYHYQIFGLTLASEVALPRLAACEPQGRHIDVRVTLSDVSSEGLSDATVVYPQAQFTSSTMWFSVAGVGRFLVTEGRLIEVDPHDAVDMQTVCLFILGSCLGAVIHQRKQLILHGNAIKIGNSAIIFTGPSGIGKSTTAAGFHKRGFPILADDLSVIDDKNRVWPSYPQIKLWTDTIDQLGYRDMPSERIRFEIDKFEIPIHDLFHPEPARVSTVYVLHKHDRPEFLFEEITGVKKLAPLQEQTYRKLCITGMGLLNEHVKNCLRLAQSIRVVNVTRPERGFEIDKLIDLTLADCKIDG